MNEVPGRGAVPAKIMLVGEAPGADEEIRGEPFCGASGLELNRMLTEVGISRNNVFVSNICRHRPPNNDIEHFVSRAKKRPGPEWHQYREGWVTQQVIDGLANLKQEIHLVSPNLLVAFGNVSMWALTGRWGITDWRGSELRADFGPTAESGAETLPPKVIPTYHPAAVLRQWSWRSAVITDLRRAVANSDSRSYPQRSWIFDINPTFHRAHENLSGLLRRLDAGVQTISFDLETRHGHIACAGFATSSREAFCIPFMAVGRADGFWPTADEEACLIRLIQQCLTHRNARVVGQNLLYDAQYTWRHWHFVPRVVQDTMISHHTAFVELPKALDFQASLYCDSYTFWKNDGKNWDPKVGEQQLWTYNCEDACRTFEVAEKTLMTIEKFGLQGPHDFQQKMFWPVLQAMQRGVRIDNAARSRIAMELVEEIAKRESFLEYVLGHPLNPRSTKQMMDLFYGDFKVRPVINRATGRPSLNDEALQKIGKTEPLLRPIIRAISDIRTLGIFLNTFVRAPLDADGRMRCSYNVCGTQTFRLSSSENAFGSGTNLQNIPSAKSKSVGKAAQRNTDSGSDAFAIPNLRSLFVPDPGFTFFDMDLDRADLQVVVWEAGDTELKEMLHEGVDIHTENARLLFGPNAGKHQREFAKVFIHGTNYGGSPRTMAIHTGVTVAEADRMQQRWFSAHPGIRLWHKRTEDQLFKRRFIENRFGNRWYVFDRPDGLLGEALAWVPQSTVALVINRIWLNLYEHAPDVQVLLQVHDSLAGQFPTHKFIQSTEQLKQLSRITIPYDDPLVIPAGLKTSEKSWGECG